MHPKYFLRACPALRNEISGLLHQIIRHRCSSSQALMRAISIKKHGGPSVLSVNKVPKPIPGNFEVLVNVKAAGINPVDIYIREGAFSRLPPLPLILGKEAAGIIESVGPGVKKLKEGDRVTCCLPRDGGYAENVTCHENFILPLPNCLTFAQGACLYVAYFAAYRALVTKCNIKNGQKLFVHGASGGVGLAAVQIAKSIGLTVTGTGSSELGLGIVKKAGADHVIDHSKTEYLAESYAKSDMKGYDVILENCADENLGNDFLLLAPSGKIALVGTKGHNKSASPTLVSVNPRSLMYTEGEVYGVQLLAVSQNEFIQYSAAIQDGITDGWLRPVIAREFKLSQAPEAHQQLSELPSYGNLVFNLEL